MIPAIVPWKKVPLHICLYHSHTVCHNHVLNFPGWCSDLASWLDTWGEIVCTGICPSTVHDWAQGSSVEEAGFITAPAPLQLCTESNEFRYCLLESIPARWRSGSIYNPGGQAVIVSVIGPWKKVAWLLHFYHECIRTIIMKLRARNNPDNYNPPLVPGLWSSLSLPMYDNWFPFVLYPRIIGAIINQRNYTLLLNIEMKFTCSNKSILSIFIKYILNGVITWID